MGAAPIASNAEQRLSYGIREQRGEGQRKTGRDKGEEEGELAGRIQRDEKGSEAEAKQQVQKGEREETKWRRASELGSHHVRLYSDTMKQAFSISACHILAVSMVLVFPAWL